MDRGIRLGWVWLDRGIRLVWGVRMGWLDWGIRRGWFQLD